MTIGKVQWIIRSKIADNLYSIINFGFSIGFLQVYFGETERKWWTPIVPYLKRGKTDLEKVQITMFRNFPSFIQLSNLFTLGDVLDESYQISYQPCESPIAIDWLMIGKEILLENDRIKRIFWCDAAADHDVLHSNPVQCAKL